MSDEVDIEDPAQLVAYLKRMQRILPDETLNVRVLQGGVSNKTVLVERASGEAWVLKQALAKLRVKVDWFSDVRRIHREALGLKVLEDLTHAGATTPLIFEDEAHHLLAMKAVPQPHANWKAMLLAGDVRPGHVQQFAEMLAGIHRKSAERTSELQPMFEDRTFFETLRVEPYFQYSASQVPDAAPFISELVTRTRTRALTLVHGDFSPKNILVYDDQLILLDHEVIHWGDPAFDVGFSLTHLLSKAHHLPARRSAFAAAAKQYWSQYCEGVCGAPWADGLERMCVWHTLGCMLARVAGRSPLEYLDAAERERQQRVVIRSMQMPPESVKQLIDLFVKEV